ncbi:MAG: hypothetical protein IPK97_02450 [Ahniella sp.]|nr:hypothetical protein [Ahniella sp.]
MNILTFPQLRLLAATALLAALGMGSAMADETPVNKTKLKFKHGEQVETISFEGQLTVGQSIGLYSEAGTPVTVRRTEQGLKVEFPDRSHDVPYPEDDVAGGDGERNIVIIKKESHGEVGDLQINGISSDPEVQAEIDAALAAEGGDGKVRKIIIKHVEDHETTDGHNVD